jgi:hypothetical protein
VVRFSASANGQAGTLPFFNTCAGRRRAGDEALAVYQKVAKSSLPPIPAM